MAPANQHALLTLVRLRETTLQEARLALQQATRLLDNRQAQCVELQAVLEQALANTPAHPNTFADASSMQQADAYKRRHARLVTECRNKHEVALALREKAQQRRANCQQQVQTALAELEVVRRKLAAQQTALDRTRRSQEEEAVDELRSAHARHSEGHKKL